MYTPQNKHNHQELICLLQSNNNCKLHLFLLQEEITEKDEPMKKYKNQDLTMVTIDTSVLNTFKKEIALMSYQFSNLNEQIEYLKLTYSKICKMLKNVHMSFNAKILILEDSLKKF